MPFILYSLFWNSWDCLPCTWIWSGCFTFRNLDWPVHSSGTCHFAYDTCLLLNLPFCQTWFSLWQKTGITEAIHLYPTTPSGSYLCSAPLNTTNKEIREYDARCKVQALNCWEHLVYRPSCWSRIDTHDLKDFRSCVASYLIWAMASSMLFSFSQSLSLCTVGKHARSPLNVAEQNFPWKLCLSSSRHVLPWLSIGICSKTKDL